MLSVLLFSCFVVRRRFVRSARFLLLLIPAGSCVAGFWGCGASVERGSEAAGVGGSSHLVSGAQASGSSNTGFVTSSGVGGAHGAGLTAPCMNDSDCGGDLWCLHPTMVDPVFGGGAPRGF